MTNTGVAFFDPQIRYFDIDEFRAGDLIRITQDVYGLKRGMIGVVEGLSPSTMAASINGTTNWLGREHVERVSPLEALAEAAE